MGAGAMLGMQAAGMGISVMGAMNQAKGEQSMATYRAAVNTNNAKVAEYQAQQEQVIGAQQEQTQRIKTAGIEGSQRAAMAANGIDLGQGSATDVLTTTAYMGERDALTIRDNAARREWGYRINAQNLNSEASAYSATASAINPTMSGLTSLLGGATGLAKSYKTYQDATKGKGA